MERILKKLCGFTITTRKYMKRKQPSFRVEVGDDIVFEILTWLPAKSLMRFRCVCKAWNTLIRHSNFVKSHNTRSQARPSATHLLFLLDIRRSLYWPPNLLPPTERFSLQFAPNHYSYTHEVSICSNHCNGLVCYYNKHHDRVCLYNATTGETKALPFSLSNETWSFPTLFLGCDLVTGKYKLLHLFYDEGRPQINILTLGTNSWREIEIIPENSSPFYFCWKGIFFNGVLYWSHSSDDPIDYFDFGTEKFGLLSPPADQERSRMQTTMWEKLELYWSSSPNRHKNCYLIPDEVREVLMKFNADDSNSEKVATLREAELSDKHDCVLATTSFISAPATLVFPSHFELSQASSFVENIIPLTFIDF